MGIRQEKEVVAAQLPTTTFLANVKQTNVGEYDFSIVFIGDINVGKTSVMKYLLEDKASNLDILKVSCIPHASVDVVSFSIANQIFLLPNGQKLEKTLILTDIPGRNGAQSVDEDAMTLDRIDAVIKGQIARADVIILTLKEYSFDKYSHQLYQKMVSQTSIYRVIVVITHAIQLIKNTEKGKVVKDNFKKQEPRIPIDNIVFIEAAGYDDLDGPEDKKGNCGREDLEAVIGAVMTSTFEEILNAHQWSERVKGWKTAATWLGMGLGIVALAPVIIVGAVVLGSKQ